MSSFVPNKKFLNTILIHCFNMGEFASDSHRILTKLYGNLTPTALYCQQLFERFKRGNFDFDFEYEECAGASKMMGDERDDQVGLSRKLDNKEIGELSNNMHEVEVVQPEAVPLWWSDSEEI